MYAGPSMGMVVMTIALAVAPRLQHGHNFQQDVDGGPGMVELSAAVVADDDAGETELGGPEGVFCALDALEEDGQAGDGA